MKRTGATLAAVLVGLVMLGLWLAFRKETSPRRPVQPRPPIMLANRTVDPAALSAPPVVPPAALSPRGTCAFVVQSPRPVTAVTRAEAAALGARVIAYIPQNALLVEASPAVVRRMLATGPFASALAYGPADKMRRGLTGGLVTVVPLAEEDRPALVRFVEENGGTPRLSGPARHGSFRAEVSDELLTRLSCRGDVRWLDRYVQPKVSNDYATQDTGVCEVRDALGLTGAGQVIATADTGVDTGVLSTLHADLRGRIVKLVNMGDFTTADYYGHGTHTAGTLAGNGAKSKGQYSGVAPQAELYVQACGDKDGTDYVYFTNASTYEDLFAAGIPFGAYIHSDSWGGSGNGVYEEFCAGVDEVMWQRPELLVVMAAGNSGSRRQTVGAPGVAKNVLTVGNVYSTREQTQGGKIYVSSSRGPCVDGRIKPDVCAPGRNIVSARSSLSKLASYGGNTSYAKMTGTSMSTPHVAGCAALVRQWLVEQRSFTNELPSAALVKAILTGGAKGPSGTSLPDNDYGWGEVALAETLSPQHREVRLYDRLPFTQGGTLVYDLTLANDAPLDVQLNWIDYPGEASAARMLVNDLDLVVSNRTTGAVWRGNGAADGDRVNNAESVRLAKAAAGKYAVIVKGVNVPYDFCEGGAAALYVRGAIAATEKDGDDFVTLTVSADCPTDVWRPSLPSLGSFRFPRNSRLTLTGTAHATGTNAYGMVVSRYACAGFSGTGSVPAAGTGGSCDVVLERDSQIVWRYEQEPCAYMLRFYSYNPGADHWIFEDPLDNYNNSEESDAVWVAAGSTVTVAVPEDLPRGDAYDYEGWICYWEELDNGDEVRYYYEGALQMKLGEVELAPTDEGGFLCLDDRFRMAKTFSFEMDGAKDIWAYYYDVNEMTDDQLPVWWHCRYLAGGYFNGAITKDATRASGDPDGDGFDNGTEYADGTDPVDDASFRFAVGSFSPTGMTFTASIKGELVVERTASLSEAWTGVLTNSAPRTSTSVSVRLPQDGSNGFYRVIHRSGTP